MLSDRIITVNEYGAAPALTNVPDPRPGPGQIPIKVGAAGVNPMDRSMAAGAWKEIACELMVLGRRSTTRQSRYSTS